MPREPWPALVRHLPHERLDEPVALESLGWTAAGPLAYVSADDDLNNRGTSRGSSRACLGGGC